MKMDYEEVLRVTQEHAKRHYEELRALESLHKELHFVPRNPKDKKLKPFYGTMEVTDAGNCYVTVTRDEEAPWLKKGREIYMEFGECCDFMVTPVEE